MDIPGNAIVALANDFQFRPGQRVTNPAVESRMFLWCRRGRGSVVVDGTTVPFPPGNFLFTPWMHTIAYHPDDQDPMLVAGIHLIPDAPVGAPFEFRVQHGPTQRMDSRTPRRDAPCPGVPDLLVGTFDQRPALEWLACYIVAWYQREPRDEAVARGLARTLFVEITLAATAIPHGLCAPLGRMLALGREQVDRCLDVAALARAGGCSASTATRLFRAGIGRSPLQWLLDLRMQRARELLAGGVIPVAEVGRRVGFADPAYFCRTFRRRHGITAMAYRRRRSLLPPSG